MTDAPSVPTNDSVLLVPRNDSVADNATRDDVSLNSEEKDAPSVPANDSVLVPRNDSVADNTTRDDVSLNSEENETVYIATAVVLTSLTLLAIIVGVIIIILYQKGRHQRQNDRYSYISKCDI